MRCAQAADVWAGTDSGGEAGGEAAASPSPQPLAPVDEIDFTAPIGDGEGELDVTAGGPLESGLEGGAEPASPAEGGGILLDGDGRALKDPRKNRCGP